MVNPEEKQPSNTLNPEDADHLPVRKIYQKPQLEELGDLRTLTLGTSPGVLDSLSPSNRKP